MSFKSLVLLFLFFYFFAFYVSIYFQPYLCIFLMKFSLQNILYSTYFSELIVFSNLG